MAGNSKLVDPTLGRGPGKEPRFIHLGILLALRIPRKEGAGQPVPDPQAVGDEPSHQGVIRTMDCKSELNINFISQIICIKHRLLFLSFNKLSVP